MPSTDGGEKLIRALAFATRKRDTFKLEDLEFITTVSQYISVALERSMTEGALHQAQQELKEHALQLETKIKERTSALEDTVAQLESFSYTVAHDLRAPIRALKGYAEMLLPESEQVTPEKAKHYLQRMNRAADRLDALTRDLLQFSSVSRQNVQLSRIDLGELLQDLRNSLCSALQEDVLLVREPLEPVLANRTLLQQCLSNLLDNALKFIQPGRKPRIVVWTSKVNASEKKVAPFLPALLGGRVSKIEESGIQPVETLSGSAPGKERVRISIEESGIGVAPESRQKIFGIFERLNPADKYEGTGIGLAIVARAMQRMGGSCGVDTIQQQRQRKPVLAGVAASPGVNQSSPVSPGDTSEP